MFQSTFPINMLMCEEGETESTLDKVVKVSVPCVIAVTLCTNGLVCLVAYDITLWCMVNLM